MDACQDVFVRVLERRQSLEARYPSSLLYTIATHVCLNRIRDRNRRPTTSDESVLFRIASAQHPGALAEARLMLARLFGRHPDSTRLIAVLHYLDGLTLEQVAEHVGLSVSGVRKRLRGLRQTLVEMEKR
jgi:RNA polymerase sigma-70 factor (ECF subfamily)